MARRFFECKPPTAPPASHPRGRSSLQELRRIELSVSPRVSPGARVSVPSVSPRSPRPSQLSLPEVGRARCNSDETQLRAPWPGDKDNSVCRPKARSKTSSSPSPSRAGSKPTARQDVLEMGPSFSRTCSEKEDQAANALTKETLHMLSTRDFADHLRRCGSECTTPGTLSAALSGGSEAAACPGNQLLDDYEHDAADLAVGKARTCRLPSILRWSSDEEEEEPVRQVKTEGLSWRMRLRRA
ncbi:unnamed protein product, partial [Effrenium voratum]